MILCTHLNLSKSSKFPQFKLFADLDSKSLKKFSEKFSWFFSLSSIFYYLWFSNQIQQNQNNPEFILHGNQFTTKQCCHRQPQIQQRAPRISPPKAPVPRLFCPQAFRLTTIHPPAARYPFTFLKQWHQMNLGEQASLRLEIKEVYMPMGTWTLASKKNQQQIHLQMNDPKTPYFLFKKVTGFYFDPFSKADWKDETIQGSLTVTAPLQ